MSATTRPGARNHQNPNRPQEQPRALPVWDVALHTQIIINADKRHGPRPPLHKNPRDLQQLVFPSSSVFVSFCRKQSLCGQLPCSTHKDIHRITRVMHYLLHIASFTPSAFAMDLRPVVFEAL